MILYDTNILIEFYKDNADVKAFIKSIGVSNLAVSIVTVGELYFGARDKRELGKIRNHLALLKQVRWMPNPRSYSSRLSKNTFSAIGSVFLMR